MRILELWRYPMKSMAGERLDRVTLGARGIVGDRGWAVRDEVAGEIRGAKKMAALLQCRARYVEEPGRGALPAVEITFPDGGRARSDDPAAAAKLSDVVGRRVSLWPLQAAEDREHLRRAAPDDPDMLAELRAIFGRTADEPLPDISIFPPEIIEFTSPLGTYFDAFDLHLLTTATLAQLRERNPEAQFDVRRFRPNIVTDAEGMGFVEAGWCGKTLRLGDTVRLKVHIPCVRCVMTTLPQFDLPKDPSVLRTVVRDAEQNVGVYLSVATAGELAVGDPVVVEE